MISIIIPALNEEKFLPNLLASLVRQTDKNFEVIVVDGSSKDKTVDVAKSFSSKLSSLQIVVSKKASLPLQRNIGAKTATGDWLVFIDADSVLLEYFVERIKQFIELHKPQLFTTWFRPDSEDPRDALFTLFFNSYVEATLIFKRPLSPGPLTAVKRSVFDAIGGYDEKHAYNEDVDLGLRLSKIGVHIAILREALCIWSLRRFRQEGLLRVLNQYFVSTLPIFFFNTSFKYMPGYVMGGHVYAKKRRQVVQMALKRYEKKLKNLMKEFLE